MDMARAMEINPKLLDPKFKYSWVLDEKKAQVVFRGEDMGYETAKVSEHPQLKDDPRVGADGTFRLGDLVLMRCPKEKYEVREKDRMDRNKKRVAAIKEEFHAEGARLGVPTYEDPNP